MMQLTDSIKILPATIGKTADGKPTIRGLVHSIRDIPTKTGTKKILVSVGDVICKIFGTAAESFIENQSRYEGKEAGFYGRWDNSRPGRKEFICDGPNGQPVAVGPATTSSIVDRIQQLMHEAVTLSESERNELAETIANPKAGLEGIEQDGDIRLDPFDPAAYGLTPEAMENFRGRFELAKPVAATAEAAKQMEPEAEKKAEPVTEAIIAQPRPVPPSKPPKEVNMTEYWIELMEADPFLYPEERLKRMSGESNHIHIAEAAQSIISKRTAITGYSSEGSSSPHAAAESVQVCTSDIQETQRRPVVQGTINQIKKRSTTKDGREMTVFEVGPYHCMIFGRVAEYLAGNASEYQGKLIAVHGDWKINQRGRDEFVPERIPATPPDSTDAVTADEVQGGIEEAFIEGSGLGAVGGLTWEEREAEYNALMASKKLEQQAESSVVAA